MLTCNQDLMDMDFSLIPRPMILEEIVEIYASVISPIAVMSKCMLT